MEIRKYFEVIDNESTQYQNLGDITEECLGENINL